MSLKYAVTIARATMNNRPIVVKCSTKLLQTSGLTPIRIEAANIANRSNYMR